MSSPKINILKNNFWRPGGVLYCHERFIQQPNFQFVIWQKSLIRIDRCHFKRYAPLSESTYLTSLNSWGYAEENVSKALESTWATAYTTILNRNVILENLATQQGHTVPGRNQSDEGRITGPPGFSFISTCYAYSAPIYKEDPSAPSIPYNESVKIMNLPLLSADSIVHNKIMRDLDEAENYWPKTRSSRKALWPPLWKDENEVYLRYRQLRMNYYAVLALKARVYLYAGEKDKAFASSL